MKKLNSPQLSTIQNFSVMLNTTAYMTLAFPNDKGCNLHP